MRHRRARKNLAPHRSLRRSVEKNMLRSFFLHGQIQTTETRAQAMKPRIERLITMGKKNTLTARRAIISRTGSANVAKRVLDVISPQFINRSGGYTRIIKIRNRAGDGARVVILQLVTE